MRTETMASARHFETDSRKTSFTSETLKAHQCTRGKNSFSLSCLFQIVTACGIFFACLQYSPLLAVVSTLIIAPAIIRTSLLAGLHRQKGYPFHLMIRLRCFVGSLGVVLLTAAFACSVFVLVSLSFGLVGWMISLMAGAANLGFDAAVVGTAGGMIWGIAGAILATGLAIFRTWIPKNLLCYPNPEYSVPMQ